MSSLVKFDIAIDGGAIVSDVRKKLELNIGSKLEKMLYIDEASGWHELDLSTIKSPMLLMIHSVDANYDFDVRFDFDQERLAIDGFDDAAENGVYKEASALVNGKKQYVLELGGYIQWSASNSRWEKYQEDNTFYAYSDNVDVTVGGWFRAVGDTAIVGMEVVGFNVEPTILSCKNYFIFGPKDEAYLNSIIKFEVKSKTPSSQKFFVVALGVI